MSEIKINNITNRTGDTDPILLVYPTVQHTAFMVMPSGDSSD